MRFTHQKQRALSVDVPLPRRSIYVMTGESRVDWKHAVVPLPRAPAPPAEVPWWNRGGWRRSLTLRATKPYSDVALERLSAAFPSDARLKARLDAQRKFKAQIKNEEGSKAVTKAQMVAFRRQYSSEFSLEYLLPGPSSSGAALGGARRTNDDARSTARAPHRVLDLTSDSDDERKPYTKRPAEAATAAPHHETSSSKSAAGVVDLTSDSDDDSDERKPTAKRPAEALATAPRPEEMRRARLQRFHKPEPP